MNRQKKIEIAIIAFMLLVSLLVIGILYLTPGGSRVVVSVGGKEYGSYSLLKNQEIEIVSPNGTNILKIQDGQAWVISASCPDKICMSMYPLSEEVQGLIVCLPNEVIIELK